MAVFKYKAKKINGEEIEEEREASGPEELAKTLGEQGYVLTFFKKKEQERKGSFSVFSFFQGVSVKDKMNFARNLGVMIGSGISLVKGLEVLENQTASKKFKKTLQGLREMILRGKSLSEGMEEYPNIFSSLFRAMVKAGEASGKLEESLKLVALQLEQDYELKRKIKGAMLYPAVIFFAMIGVAIFMLIYVVPTLTSTFAELEISLPPTTLVIINLSNFILHQTIVAFFVVLASFFLIWFFFKSESGQKTISRILLNFPVISTIAKEINTARTSRTLSSLIGSGVNMLEALKITEEVLQNHFYKNVLREAGEEIQKGKPISSVFIRHSEIYPRIMGEMMAVGEETGKVSEMLLNIAKFYEEEVSEKTKNLSSVIEPVLMIVIGAAVGFFAVSMIQPMYSMVGAL